MQEKGIFRGNEQVPRTKGFAGDYESGGKVSVGRVVTVSAVCVCIADAALACMLGPSPSRSTLTLYSFAASVAVFGGYFMLEASGMYKMQPGEFTDLSKGHPFKERSVLGGCSGIFYALPVVFGFASMSPLESAYLVLQAIVSMCSDYFFVFDRSIFHPLDRFIAKAGTIYYLWVSYQAGFSVFLEVWLPTLCIFITGHHLRKQKMFIPYSIAHFFWHLCGGSGIAFVHWKYLSPRDQSS